MQEMNPRRSNKDRSDATRAALIAAGRALFTERSYAGIGTPEIVAKAGVTRGALYHHFADKQALFTVVVEAESALVADEIERAAPTGLPPLEALVVGGEAYLDAMLAPGRTRLLLLDAPAVLGRVVADEIDGRHAARTLREGLEAAMAAGAMAPLPLEVLTQMLSAAYARAALGLDAGEDRRAWQRVMEAVFAGLAGSA